MRIEQDDPFGKRRYGQGIPVRRHAFEFVARECFGFDSSTNISVQQVRPSKRIIGQPLGDNDYIDIALQPVRLFREPTQRCVHKPEAPRRKRRCHSNHAGSRTDMHRDNAEECDAGPAAGHLS